YVGDPLREKELRRPDRAAAEHDRAGPCDVPPGVLAMADDPRHPAALDDDLLHPHAGPYSRAGGYRSRELRLVHRALGAERAAHRTRAAADDPARIAGDGPVRQAEGVGAGAAELAVAPRAAGLDQADGQIALERLVLAVECRRPRDPVHLAPAAEDARGRAEARARVDHGRAANAAPERQRDRRPALARRQAAVAVERRQRVERVARIREGVVV